MDRLRNVLQIDFLLWKRLWIPVIFRHPEGWRRPKITSLLLGPLEIRVYWKLAWR